MKFNWHSLFTRIAASRRSNQLIIIFICLLLAVHWLVVCLGLPQDQASIFLHYTVYFGVDNTGSYLQALWIPGVASGIAVVNIFLAYTIRQERMRTTLLAFTAALEMLVLISAVLIVIINLPS